MHLSIILKDMVTERRLQRIETACSQKQEGIIVLQDIHDPHNAQAVIRSCECFGIQTIYLIFEKEKRFNPSEFGKLASSSANKWLDYKIFESTQDCMTELKASGYKIVATSLKEESQTIYDFDFTAQEKIALCFGNEQVGLNEAAISQADSTLYIPMHGMIQSLNLSVTAALCLFEMTRQRKAKNFDQFLFSKEKQESLKEKFLAEHCN